MCRSQAGIDRREGTVNVVKGGGACRGSLLGEGKLEGETRRSLGSV